MRQCLLAKGAQALATRALMSDIERLAEALAGDNKQLSMVSLNGEEPSVNGFPDLEMPCRS